MSSNVDERSLERTQELDAQLLAMHIQGCQIKAIGYELQPVGQCHVGCGQTFENLTQKFCDEDCADDWHDAIKAEQRNTGIYNPHSLIKLKVKE